MHHEVHALHNFPAVIFLHKVRRYLLDSRILNLQRMLVDGHTHDGLAAKQFLHEIRANKARSACDQYHLVTIESVRFLLSC